MIQYLRCNSCNKTVSTGFEPIPTPTPDKGIVIRAYIECPECMEKKISDRQVFPRGEGG